MEPADIARVVVAEQLGPVRNAIFTGSAAEGRATDHSDIDVVALIDGEPAPYRETLRSHGWVVELFVHDDASIEHFFDLERRQRRCTLANMIASGQQISGDEGSALQEAARAFIEVGPAPLDDSERERWRYRLAGAMDDLNGAGDGEEREIVAAQVLMMAAELCLVSRRQWGGEVKWLLRNLRGCDPKVSRALMQGYREAVTLGDTDLLTAACDDVLISLGGQLREGYVVRG